jgi:putative phosphoesterase
MKIAVLSDVHGNVPALEAVLDDIAHWAPDHVVINGDLINRGPRSLAVYGLTQALSLKTSYVKGNHEQFVLSEAAGREPVSPDYDLTRFARWTARQMGQALEEVAGWADELELTDPEGGRAHLTHGTRLGNRDAIRPETPDEELPAKLGDPRELFVTSHTHTPLVREYGPTLIVNTGSVGSPFDRDPRAAYAQLSFSRGHWQARIRRVPFDRARAEQDFFDSGFIDGAGPLARVMLAEFHHNRGLMGRWMRTYHRAVLEEQITVARAVEEYLRG